MMKTNKKIMLFFKFMWTKTKEVRKFLPVIFLMSTFLSIVSFIVAILNKNLLDYLLNTNGKFDVMLPVLLVMIFIQAVLNYVLSIINTNFLDKYIYRIQLHFYQNILNSNHLFNRIISSSDVYYRMFTDIRTMVNFYVHLIIKLPLEFIVLVVSTTILIIWNPILLGLYYLLVLIQILIVFIFKKRIKANYKLLKTKEEKYIQNINENTQRIDIIKSLDLSQYCCQDADEYFNEYLKQDLKSTAINGTSTNLISIVGQLWNIGILFLGIHFVLNGKLTLGTLFGFSMLSSILSSSINDFISAISSYQNAVVSFERFKEFEPADIFVIKEKKDFIFSSKLEIQNLVFSYVNNTVFYKLNYTFNKDCIYLIQGNNGCGKTTLCRLISRFLNPDYGQILIDETNIDSIKEKDFRNNVIYINSEPMIFNKSIYDNIVLNKKFDKTEIDNIVDMCGLSAVVKKHGLYTNLGLSEGSLSLGEKQKIALARAIIRKPQIIILDEPTAHVDMLSALDIIKLIKQYQMSYKSLIIVCSHDIRLENITTNILNLNSLMNIEKELLE